MIVCKKQLTKLECTYFLKGKISFSFNHIYSLQLVIFPVLAFIQIPKTATILRNWITKRIYIIVINN